MSTIKLLITLQWYFKKTRTIKSRAFPVVYVEDKADAVSRIAGHYEGL